MTETIIGVCIAVVLGFVAGRLWRARRHRQRERELAASIARANEAHKEWSDKMMPPANEDR